MNTLLTTAGQALVASSLPVPPVFSEFRLGDAYGYLPTGGQTSLVGSVVHTGVPLTPQIVSGNLIKYTLALDSNTGPFQFGEVGLYLPGGVLGAVGTASTPIDKQATSGAAKGNALVVDLYLSTVGTSYSVYAELGNSDNPLNLSASSSVDSLPQASTSVPNIFMVTAPDLSGSVLAHSNNAVWSIQGYEEIVLTASVVTSTASTVESSLAGTNPEFPGELVLQFTSGTNLGTCRVVTGFNTLTSTYQFASPLATLPVLGDTFQVLKKTLLRPVTSSFLAALDPSLPASAVNALLTTPLSSLVRIDGTTPRTGNDSLGGYRLTNVGSPVFPTDAATMGYVTNELTSKQPTLVSGANLSTVNGADLLSGANVSTNPVSTPALAGRLLSSSDAWNTLICDATTPQVFTLQTDAVGNFSAYTVIRIYRASTGTVTIAPGSATLLGTPPASAAYSTLAVHRVAPDTWAYL